MSKITSKYQVTVPKAIAEKYDIGPGDEIEWIAAGEVIRVVPPGQKTSPEDRESQLRLFDQATERNCRLVSKKQPTRKQPTPKQPRPPRDRGWRREDLYDRGRSH